MLYKVDHLCVLVVRVPGYRVRDPGLIPGATRFFEKYRVCNGVKSASLSTTEELLGRKSSGSGLESRGIRHVDHVAPSICKSWH
jgi:hypothetical protein